MASAGRSGQCEACDVVGGAGTCSAVSGAPHTASGARSACPTGADVCSALACDGSKDRTKCVGFAHGPETSCEQSCAGGTLSVGKCDGAGSCSTPKSSPCPGGFLCDTATSACKTACAAQSDCQPSFACKSGGCAPATGSCSADGASAIGADGVTAQPCAPYLCDPGSATCATSCGSSAECQAGTLCDDTGKCVASTPAAQSTSSGGCGFGGATGSGEGVALSALALALLGARRRRAR